MNPMLRVSTALALCAAPLAVQAQEAPSLLHPMFQDHGVLQRGRPIPVWGDAAPGALITATLAGKAVTARADKAGHWRVALPAMPAGGPYTLTASSGARSETASDLMIGDVWLCSGQSNMEFQVRQAMSGGAEAASANDGQLRLLTVGKKVKSGPASRFDDPIRWQSANPASVADFSAACYFMGRDLRQSQKVPIGLVAASWGGTAIDAWRSEASFAGEAAAQPKLALLSTYRKDPAKAAATFGETWANWWRGKSNGGAEPWRAGAAGDWQPVPSFTTWETWGVPRLADYNGLVFFRTEVQLTPAQAAQAATLGLGPPDDTDMTWINGVGVGSDTAWGVPRAYPIAKGTLKPGRNTIVVAVYDSWGSGGLAGTPEQRALRFADGTRLPLPSAVGWQYQVGPDLGEPPRTPWDGIAGLSGIYNGMIAPLGSYAFTGAAWYQGETDAGKPNYSGKLASMMQGWRRQFDSPDLPFLIVQLAGWRARNTTPVEDGTAGIRDEQRKAVAADPRTALIVTVDIGDVDDIHPANKQVVGHRLARAAESLVYGSGKTPSGPRIADARLENGQVIVTFDSLEGKLSGFSGAPLGFEICGRASSCEFVSAALSASDTVSLPASGAAPGDRVRYCWGGSPVCNLTDASGLPASPFEVAIR